MMKLMRLNENGSVLNVALLIIIMLSLIGLGVHRVVTLDNKIGINVKRSWAKFYEAEGVLNEAAQWLEDKTQDTLRDKSMAGLYNEADLMDGLYDTANEFNFDNNNYPLYANANNDGEIDDDELLYSLERTIRADSLALNRSDGGWPGSAWPDPEGNSRNFITVDYGVALGSSLVMNDPSRLHQFLIAARAQDARSDAVIKAGYLKRY